MLGSKRKRKATKVDTLVGKGTRVEGDVVFSGGLHVEGVVKGNVTAEEGTTSLLTVSEQGQIEGEVDVPSIVLDGSVVGNVYAAERIELAPRARVQGNVYYNLIEMAIGAEVNGSLVHDVDQSQPRLAFDRQEGEPSLPEPQESSGGQAGPI